MPHQNPRRRSRLLAVFASLPPELHHPHHHLHHCYHHQHCRHCYHHCLLDEKTILEYFAPNLEQRLLAVNF